ncbi:Oligopeptide transport ATP-binding protein OppF [Vibrio aerogenes CECT 7868]|uniref:Oligopeptide transport ATP-binding protein OppF n=1 Tax=Vibrio aerogenes CECT 7868 TaxID=1216006 RepID=A0A1M5YRI1_9VIBR|nr:oligopeptide/dipeptide ABC transporter ATP-binding protein [Vibrio aerogenes]SHI14474.1 Oligopeptide transport ATP-binding protein OppF [Vibrio aerogenes CECT 7868]
MTQTSDELLRINQLEKVFLLRQGWNEVLKAKRTGFSRDILVHALNGVSFSLFAGERLCVVGESGCGKSTLARTVIGLLTATAGEIYYRDERIDHLNDHQRMKFRKKIQMIFQNPYASLNPKMTVYQMLQEALSIHLPDLNAEAQNQRICALLDSVGLSTDAQHRYPHEFSGGQHQRISLARALSVEPELIIADEPLSALDVSVQAQVLNLMMEKQQTHQLTYLFITHDLAVVEHFATRVVVMYLGRVCEIADRATLFSAPKHPYTKALLSSIPRLDNLHLQPTLLKGEVPTTFDIPEGCIFCQRCPIANQRCYEEIPVVQIQPDGSEVACHAVREGRC